jgi:hypothetical protein
MRMVHYNLECNQIFTNYINNVNKETRMLYTEEHNTNLHRQ